MNDDLNVQVLVRDTGGYPGPGVVIQLSEDVVRAYSPEVLSSIIDERFKAARMTLVNLIEERTGKAVK